MEAAATLGLVGNVIQLVDLSTKIVFKIREIRADSEVKDYRERQTVTTELRNLNAKLVGYLTVSDLESELSEDDKQLCKLCRAANEIADGLSRRLEKCQPDPKAGFIRITRQVVKQLWIKDELDDMVTRLQEYRSQLNTGILVSLRKKLDILDSTTQTILLRLEDNRTLYNAGQETQRQYLTNLVVSQHDRTRELIETLHLGQSASIDLVQSGAGGVGSESRKKFWDAVRNHNVNEIRKALFEDPTSVFECNSHGQTALHLAAMTADIEMAECLTKQGAMISPEDENKRTPLHYAVQSGSFVVARLLLIKGATASARDTQELTPRDLCEPGSLLEWVLTRGSNLEEKDVSGRTALAFFSETGDDAAVQCLLQQGANVETTTSTLWTPLFHAAAGGHKSTVQLLLGRAANINHRDRLGCSILVPCVTLNRSEIAEELLQNGADIEAKDDKGRTPLMLACSSRPISLETVRTLLGHGASCKQVTADGQMPIHIAAASGSAEIVQVLLEHKNDANALVAETNVTALHLACEHDHIDVVKTLLDNGASMNAARKPDGWTPIMVAINKERLSILEYMLQRENKGLEVTDSEGLTALLHAVKNGNSEMVKLLLNGGADTECLDREQFTPLCWACQQCNEDIAKLLIKAGANVNTATFRGWTPLHQVCLRGNLPITRLLLQNRADPNLIRGVGYTSLNLAAQRGHLSIIRELLEFEIVDVNIPNADGWTSLAEASFHGHSEIARLLLAHGAAVNSRDRKGFTPLSRAATRNRLNVAMQLLDHGADVTAENVNGWSSLAEASLRGYNDIVRLLLARGAPADSRDSEQYTPLLRASMRDQVSAAQQLLEAGADPNAANHDGWTPLAEASWNDRVELAELLLKYGASKDAVNAHGNTPLALAAIRRHKRIIELLEREG